MRILATLLALVAPAAVAAQTAATLVADNVTVSPDHRLTATGNVEVFYEGTRLTAGSITYSEAGDTLTIDGPILIRAADGTIFTADSATLDPRLQNGILLSARLVLDERLQMAANRIDRVDGRYTQLTKVAATSCNICANRAPLWDIRAENITHDEDAQQIYLDNATLRVRGVPIMWLPWMRLPDPSLTRATGFLIPKFSSSDALGTGFRIPYFIRMGDYRDLTLTPFVTGKTNTFEARYRQAFANGDIEVNTAITRDDLLPDQNRSYMSVQGNFTLPQDWALSFDVASTSDKGYMLQYGYSDDTFLESVIRAEQIGATGMTWAELSLFQSLLDDTETSDLPPVVAEAGLEQTLAFAGGELTYQADADLYMRYGTATDGSDRDAGRLGVGLYWDRQDITGTGLVIDSHLGAGLDWFSYNYDPDLDTVFRAVPEASVKLSYPLMRSGNGGAVNIIEPAVMLGWTDAIGGTPVNEDSARVEFDETNLLSLSRYPGEDAVETGLQGAAGLSWQRIDPHGWRARFVFGQVYHFDDQGFSDTSGLAANASDYLIAGQFALLDGFTMTGRTLMDQDFTLSKSELAVGWDGIKMDLTASYIWLAEDEAEDRANDISEWAVDANYQFDRIWSLGLNGRYNVVTNEPARAGATVGWNNECVSVELSASRRYTSSTTVEPSTDYSLSVGLAGFGTGATNVAPRACSN